MNTTILNIPHHIKRLRVVSSQRVALVMAGEYTLNTLSEIDSKCDPMLWQTACTYHTCIFSAVKFEGLECISYSESKDRIFIKALFLPEVIWPWALAELSDTSPWYGADSGTSGAVALPSTEITSPPVCDSTENDKYLIAGLAKMQVAQNGSKYLRGQNLNISALARDVADVVSCGLPPSEPDKTESFRKSLTSAHRRLPFLK